MTVEVLVLTVLYWPSTVFKNVKDSLLKGSCFRHICKNTSALMLRKLCIFPMEFIYVFLVIPRTEIIIIKIISWLVFVMEKNSA
jgi:hypothetical protein